MEDDYISQTFLEGNTIVGICKGSYANFYTLSVSFGQTNIQKKDCSCPAFASFYNACKHIIVFLFIYLNNPYKFSQREPWDKVMKKLSKYELKDILTLITNYAPLYKTVLHEYIGQQKKMSDKNIVEEIYEKFESFNLDVSEHY